MAIYLLIYSSSTYSQDIEWNVRPNVCIVEDLGTFCEMDLQIQISNLRKGTYCYYLGSQLLQCWSHDSPVETIKLSFSEATTLSLKDQQHKTVLTQALEIKVRQKSIKTRRVRQPWSLF